MSKILEMENISKSFLATKALDKVSLAIEDLTIHAIAGENGAGKSTLMKVLSGVYTSSDFSGNIIFQGQKCYFRKIRDSEKLGIVIIHQELALIPELSVYENIFLGNEISKYAVLKKSEMLDKSLELLSKLNCNISPYSIIKNIGIGHQQLIEIAKALAKKVRVLILDEPTAALNDSESRVLLDTLVDLKKHGVTSILITHKLDEIKEVADELTVLRDGQVVGHFLVDKSLSESRIVQAMVGRSIDSRFPPRINKLGFSRDTLAAGEKLLEIRNWTVYDPLLPRKKKLDNINIYLQKGEVVGLSGLIGAGRTELAKSIFGQFYGVNISGDLLVEGQKKKLLAPKLALDLGIFYLAEDRKNEGLILMASVKDNIGLGNFSCFSQLGFINKELETDIAEEAVNNLKIKSTNIFVATETLSGGNQQKVVLAKAVLAQPKILILDEPTRGIDVGAKYEIYKIINSLVSKGMSCLLISSDMSEIIGMTDRTYVMNDGRIVAELSKDNLTQKNIMSAILQYG